MAGAARRAWLRAGLVAGGVVVLDQVTKQLLVSSIGPGEHRSVVPGVLQFVHAVNHGVAFSVSAGGPEIVVVVIGVAIAAIVTYFATHADRPLLWLPAGMMVGGAVGNLVDRVRDGAVTDFVKLPHWPAFNLADATITLGVIALLYVLRDDGSPRPA
ncbi:MAG: signal peptidase [Solirubrobacteraceae bacterium]|nr:signal peptidase [Solirubrobacteraceae bacterium]